MILEQTNVPNFGLERMRHLLALRGNPHERVSVIHIGGTNGKGSTIQFLSALLQQLGVKVGVFCSPYVTDMTEQVVIDGKAIDTATFQRYRLDYQQLVDNDSQCRLAGTTGFEVLTAIAFEYFATQEVDVAIMEVGMGGA